MRLALFISLALAASAASPAVAHAEPAVRGWSVADGAEFEFSPFSITAKLQARATLVEARLVDQDGAAFPVDLSGVVRSGQEFVLELPVLPPHGYQLRLKTRDVRNSEAISTVGFKVKGCIEPRPVRS